MSFVNRLGQIVPSMGTPHANDTLFLSQANALATGAAKTITLSGLTPTVSKGYLRVKVSGASASEALTAVSASFTDGTTTENIQGLNPSASLTLGAAVVFDAVVPFELDINANACSVIVTLSGTLAPGIADIEIAGTI